MSSKKPEKINWVTMLFNPTTVFVVVWVGVLTVGIILVAVLGGLWLDRTFGTRPLFTVLLVLFGVPVSLVLTMLSVKWVMARVKANSPQEENQESENESER